MGREKGGRRERKWEEKGVGGGGGVGIGKRERVGGGGGGVRKWEEKKGVRRDTERGSGRREGGGGGRRGEKRYKMVLFTLSLGSFASVALERVLMSVLLTTALARNI